MLNCIITENSITVLIKNIPEVIDNSHPNFEKVETALKNDASEEEILRLMNVGEAVKDFAKVTEGNVQVKDGQIVYMGEIVHSALSRRIISLMEQGFDITPFTNFMENLFENPSNRSVNETYGFLEACNLPITEDGCFLAYKKITGDYKDCYTRTIDNSIGKTVQVPRNKVDENSEQTCSYGLHVASYSYMAHYPGERIVICKVNPADVVAVPSDYNNAKMRVCKYEVVNEVNLRDEEIPANVIKDEDAYDNSLRPFKDIDDALMAIRQDSFKEILERLKVTKTDASNELMAFDVSFCKIDNRTKNWRNTILDEFSPIEDDDFSEEVTKSTEDKDIDIRDFLLSESFDYIKDIFGKETVFSEALNNMTNSTYMWRKILIDILEESENPTKECEVEEMPAEHVSDFNGTFREKVLNILEQLDETGFDILIKFLNKKSTINQNFIQICIELRDYKSLAKSIAISAKRGEFKKKKFLKLWL